VALSADPPGREALAALADKYATLAELRRARARGEPIPPRATFKDLAERFPGALRELDLLPAETLAARLSATRAALAGASIEPWIPWMIAYHALMRAALRVKLRTAKLRDVPAERALSLAEDASAHAGITVDASFVRAAANPPRGRLVALVLARLASRFGEPSATIAAALFPRSATRA